jgi:hypothetical protein
VLAVLAVLVGVVDKLARLGDARLLHLRVAIVTSVQHQCNISATSVQYQCNISATPVQHLGN